MLCSVVVRPIPCVATRRFVSTYFDVVVVGGGMVGNAMTCALGKSPTLSKTKALLLENGNPKKWTNHLPENYSNRVSAVSPTSISLFKDLNVWDRLKSQRVKKVDRLQVLDSCSTSEISFNQLTKDQEIAYIIENDFIISALYEELSSCESVTVKTGSSLRECRIPENLNEMVTLTLASGEEIETSLVIGADGFRSTVRSAIGSDYTSWEYGQSGVVATLNIQTASPLNDVAWQRFTRLGPIALLPLTDNLSSLVWTTTSEEAKRLVSIPEEEFIDELNHYLFTEEDQNSFVNQTLFLFSRLAPSSPLLRSIPPQVISLQSDTRAAFPLGFGHSHSYVGCRSVVIGDAAHRIHPLAGQGVNLGWHDVLLLKNSLEKASREGADLGSLTYLSEFDSAAQRHNVPVMMSVDWLNRLYRTDAAALVALRSFGLAAVNRMEPLKNFFISRLSEEAK